MFITSKSTVQCKTTCRQLCDGDAIQKQVHKKCEAWHPDVLISWSIFLFISREICIHINVDSYEFVNSKKNGAVDPSYKRYDSFHSAG